MSLKQECAGDTITFPVYSSGVPWAEVSQGFLQRYLWITDKEEYRPLKLDIGNLQVVWYAGEFGYSTLLGYLPSKILLTLHSPMTILGIISRHGTFHIYMSIGWMYQDSIVAILAPGTWLSSFTPRSVQNTIIGWYGVQSLLVTGAAGDSLHRGADRNGSSHKCGRGTVSLWCQLWLYNAAFRRLLERYYHFRKRQDRPYLQSHVDG